MGTENRRRAIFAAAALATAVLAWGGTTALRAEEHPDARALYETMVATMRTAKSLSWVAEYTNGTEETPVATRCSYSIWLAKPNFARMEARRNGEVKGVLVCDGEDMWTYWPAGRPRYGWEHDGERGREYDRTKDISYMRQHAPNGRHSIAHLAGKLGNGIIMTILDPSTFHGYTDSLQRYLDDAKWSGEETVGDVPCDIVDISIMKGQRTWKLWLSKEDHLPRRVEQKIHVRTTYVTREEWSDVRIDGEIDEGLFDWSPPEGWEQWRMPSVNEGLLRPGVDAPDFDLPKDGGGRIRLSDLRGKTVWFYIWRAG